MSIQAIAWAYKQDQSSLSATQKFVLVTLANFAGESGQAYPSVETISQLTRHDERTVRRALTSLVDSGIIKDTGGRVGFTHQVRVYQLGCERLPNLSPFEGSKTGERLAKGGRKTGERPTKLYPDPISYNHEPIGEASSLHPVLRISHEKEYDEVTKQMKIIDGNYSGMQKWCADDIILYSKLKKRRDELRVLLGRVV